MSQKSMSTQIIMIAAGMKNTAQVASTSLPPTVTSVAKIFWSKSWNQPPVEWAFVNSMIFCPQSNAIQAEPVSALVGSTSNHT